MSDEAQALPEDTSGRGDGLTLGSRLRAAREKRELAIEKIADELRIEERVLIALEEDRLDEIGVAPVFVKGYIKQYGRMLQLDYDVLRRAFDAQIGSEDIRLRPNSSIQLRDERQITIWIIAALAVLLVGVALLVWWLGTDDVGVTGVSDQAGEPALAVQAQNPPPAPVPQQVADPVPVTEPQLVTAAPPPTEPPGESEQADNAADVPADVAEPGSLQQVEIDVSAVPPEGSVPMVFEFSDESWFELEDASGRRLYYDLVGAGRRLSFFAVPPARVLIGNAAAVTITVDSASYSIPAGSLRGNVASFAIDPIQE